MLLFILALVLVLVFVIIRKRKHKSPNLTDLGWPDNSIIYYELFLKQHFGEPDLISKDLILWRHPTPFITKMKLYNSDTVSLYITVSLNIQFEELVSSTLAVHPGLTYDRLRKELTVETFDYYSGIVTLALAKDVSKRDMSIDYVRYNKILESNLLKCVKPTNDSDLKEWTRFIQETEKKLHN